VPAGPLAAVVVFAREAFVESQLAATDAPAVRIDTLETFVELLSRVEADGSSDAFYSRLCEATCRLASMDRAVIFRYDDARRRVRAAGAYGIALDVFADAQVTVESAPIARQALEEDRVIEVAEDVSGEVPEEYRGLVRQSTLVCTPMVAAGRWLGVILSDRGTVREPLRESERQALWALGKTAALATYARLAANQQARAMWDVLTSQNRYAITYRVGQAKRPETRARRVAVVVAEAAQGRRANQWRQPAGRRRPPEAATDHDR
jgi:GAF domain-containing protein